MYLRPTFRHAFAGVLAALLIAPFVTLIAAEPAALDEILADQADRWQVLNRARQSIQPVLTQAPDRAAIRGDRGTLLLRADLKPGYEIRADIRFSLEQRRSYVQFRPGVKDPANRDEVRPFFSVSYFVDQERITMGYYFPEPDARGRYTRSAIYHLDGNGPRHLSWPEDLRRRIELETASLPAVDKVWFAIRGVIGTDRVAWYFNGLLVTEYPTAEMDPSGALEVELMPGAELAALSIVPAPEPSL